MKKRILTIIQAIEKIYKGIIAFGYKEGENTWFIAVNDYDVYMSDKFKTLCKNWRKNQGGSGKIIFCYLVPTEKRLMELAEGENLILNVV